MKYEGARWLADKFVKIMDPYCERVKIAGSIRRKRPTCHDIDLVLIPRGLKRLGLAVNEVAQVLRGGKAIWTVEFRGAQVDLYFATLETWATLLLIRTGSKEHNVFLARRARSLGMEIKASGAGLLKNGIRIAGDTEESIFAALGLTLQGSRTAGGCVRVEFKGTVTRLNLTGKEDANGVERRVVLTVEADPDVVDLHCLSLLVGLSSVGMTMEHPQAVLPGFEGAEVRA